MFWPCPYMYLIWMFITYDIGYNIYCFWPSFDFTVHIIYNTLTLTLTVRMTLIYLFFILQKHLFFSITLTHLIKWNIAWLVCRENRSAHVTLSEVSEMSKNSLYRFHVCISGNLFCIYRSVEKNPTNIWSNDYKISDKTSLIKVGFFFRFKKLAIDPVQGYQFMRALMGINTTDYWLWRIYFLIIKKIWL